MVKNLTPHPINIIGPDGENIATIAPEPTPARLAAQTVPADSIDGIATSHTVFGEPEGLPTPGHRCTICGGPGTFGVCDDPGCAAAAGPCFFVVSQLIKSALPERTDLLVPAEVVRDKSGAIIGCRSLGREVV